MPRISAVQSLDGGLNTRRLSTPAETSLPYIQETAMFLKGRRQESGGLYFAEKRDVPSVITLSLQTRGLSGWFF